MSADEELGHEIYGKAYACKLADFCIAEAGHDIMLAGPMGSRAVAVGPPAGEAAAHHHLYGPVDCPAASSSRPYRYTGGQNALHPPVHQPGP